MGEVSIAKNERAFTLLEILVVLMILGLMMGIATTGIVKFRQVIVSTSTAKELLLELRRARRHAINNVVTSDGYTPSGYYIAIEGNDYVWGECREGGGCSEVGSVKSPEFEGVEVSVCQGSSDDYEAVKFDSVTGTFYLFQSSSGINDNSTATTTDTCEITVSIKGVVSTEREIEVSAGNRTMKLL